MAKAKLLFPYGILKLVIFKYLIWIAYMKKKLLFVHDHIFTTKNDLVYSAAAFPAESWCRYLAFFDSIKVVGRHSSREGKIDGLVLSSTEFVDFHFVEYSQSKIKDMLNRKRNAKRLISEQLKSCSAVVARLPSENGNIAVKLAKKEGKPIAVEVVGCALDAYNNYGSILAKFYAPIAFYKMRKSVASASQVLYVTTDYLQKRYPANNDVFCVDASNVNLPDNLFHKRENDVKSYRIQDNLVIGLIGNFKTNYKGIDIAIKALSYLKSYGLSVSLKILGAGDKAFYDNLCRELGVEHNVEFCGSLPNGQPVMNWLEGIDIYIQPSRTEGLPRSLIEAMSQGKTCFGSNVGGIPELLNKSFLHRAGDPVDLADRILLAIKKGDIKNFDVKNYERSFFFAQKNICLKRSVFFKKLFESSR